MRTLLSWIARCLIWILGWRIVGDVPPYNRAVVIGAFHTSNWDALFLFLAGIAVKAPMRWMGKHTLFEGPLAFLFRWLGGVPINRSRSFGVVEQMVAEFQKRDEFILVLSPEGTRRRTTRWKRGFYEIARRANVPIILVAPDYRQKQLVIGPAIMPTGDIDADLEHIRAFYADKKPKFPERAGPIVVAREYHHE